MPIPEETKTASVACVPAGFYKVRVDLASAQISQVNTGMDDTEWCKSMLVTVPTAQMNAMRIGYENGMLEVRWPPSRKVSVTSKGECEFAIDDDPIPATFKFAAGRADGTATYSLGTVNHPDEKCTATNAKFSLERTGD